MQRYQNPVTPVTVNDYVVVHDPVPGCGTQMSTAQVVAAEGDKLTVVAHHDDNRPLVHGADTRREVLRKDVQSYADVYGTAVPYPGARPLVKL